MGDVGSHHAHAKATMRTPQSHNTIDKYYKTTSHDKGKQPVGRDSPTPGPSRPRPSPQEMTKLLESELASGEEATTGATSTQDTLASENTRAIRDQVRRIEEKRDKEDPDFSTSQAKSQISCTTPRGSIVSSAASRSPRPNTGIKSFDRCSAKTQRDRTERVKAIQRNWQAPMSSWIPEEVRPNGSPREWGRPMLDQLRILSGRTKRDLETANATIKHAVVARTVNSNGRAVALAQDVEAAIADLETRRQPRDNEARSTTLAAADDERDCTTSPNQRSQMGAQGSRAAAQVRPRGNDRHLPSSSAPEPTAAVLIKNEPNSQDIATVTASELSPETGLQLPHNLIDEIGEAAKEKAKAEVRQIKARERFERWKALHGQGVSPAEALVIE